jgi:hypothetical protein
MVHVWKMLVVLGVAALVAGCKSPPTQAEMGAYDYGPRPDGYEKLVRDYLPGDASIEFRAGPRELYQQETALRPLQYGWGVCVSVKDKNASGGYDDPYPMVFFIRDGKIVAVNGGSKDNVVGWRFARTGCNELGAPFVTP